TAVPGGHGFPRGTPSAWPPNRFLAGLLGPSHPDTRTVGTPMWNPPKGFRCSVASHRPPLPVARVIAGAGPHGADSRDGRPRAGGSYRERTTTVDVRQDRRLCLPKARRVSVREPDAVAIINLGMISEPKAGLLSPISIK